MNAPKIFANLSVPNRVSEAVAAGAQGIGLMRSEFLVYKTGRHPMVLAKEEGASGLKKILAKGMRTAAQGMYPNPVLYRSLDLRSNEVGKLASGEDYELHEDNPALGCRGISRSQRDEAVFDIEIEALLEVRGENLPNLRMMLPFVRWPEEVKWARAKLEAAHKPGNPPVPLWMMVETPATVLRAADFAPLVDGVSIGSNDLAQLILAVDRDNVAFASLDWDSDPAVLAGLHMAIQNYRELKVPVGICGDAPSRSEPLLELLCDWGIDSISVSLDRLAALRALIERKFGDGAVASCSAA